MRVYIRARCRWLHNCMSLLIFCKRWKQEIPIWVNPTTNVPMNFMSLHTKPNATCTTSAVREALPLTCISVETTFCLTCNIMDAIIKNWWIAETAYHLLALLLTEISLSKKEPVIQITTFAPMVSLWKM
jgi:hypothetical protein